MFFDSSPNLASVCSVLLCNSLQLWILMGEPFLFLAASVSYLQALLVFHRLPPTQAQLIIQLCFNAAKEICFKSPFITFFFPGKSFIPSASCCYVHASHFKWLQQNNNWTETSLHRCSWLEARGQATTEGKKSVRLGKQDLSQTGMIFDFYRDLLLQGVDFRIGIYMWKWSSMV